VTWLLDRMFGNRLARETAQYLAHLSAAPKQTARRGTDRLLTSFANSSGPRVNVGRTDWDRAVDVPLSELVRAHGLVTGGTGSGKSMFALLIIKALIELAPADIGFGVLDAKGELFQGAMWLLKNRLDELSRTQPEAAKKLRRRIVICDFASRDPVSPYNILAGWNGADPEFFALNRADLLMDLLNRSDKLSLGGVGVLQKLLMLLSEFSLPITLASDVVRDPALRRRLLAQSKNRELVKYFSQQFDSIPKPTLAAIERRLQALTASESVRLALNGAAAPDFRLFQDESRIVLINCFGENIARSVRRLLQGLMLSDIRQAVFARKSKDRPFLWFCDEAQNFFISERLQDNMNDLLTMSRSFGSFFMYLTQNISTAVGDARMLKVLHTNIRWALAMRGDPSDCEFLKAALPITARKLRPTTSPFEEKTFYSIREERQLLLDGISHLPDRTGYLWFKPQGCDAIKIKTADLIMPRAGELESATQPIRRDATVGFRVSRKAYEKQIAERDLKWNEPPEALTKTLEVVYRQKRGSS
jgi:Helicase HerA, central domain